MSNQNQLSCVCGFTTTSYRGYKHHIVDCFERKNYLAGLDARLDKTPLGAATLAVTGLPISVILKNNK